jgi:hypothetical protein
MLKGKGTLTSIQKSILFDFGKIRNASFFYLTGGTALAEFYLGHRRSYDLDFFTAEKELVILFTRDVEERLLHQQLKLSVIRRFESFVEFEVGKEGERVQLHFAYDSPLRFEEPSPSEFGVRVNDYQDIVVDKLLAFFGRAEPRDAVDLFFILKNENLWRLSDLAIQKDPGFDLYWLAIAFEKAREFPDRIDQWPVDMLVDIDARELKTKFLSLTQEIMDKIKKPK